MIMDTFGRYAVESIHDHEARSGERRRLRGAAPGESHQPGEMGPLPPPVILAACATGVRGAWCSWCGNPGPD